MVEEFRVDGDAAELAALAPDVQPDVVVFGSVVVAFEDLPGAFVRHGVRVRADRARGPVDPPGMIGIRRDPCLPRIDVGWYRWIFNLDRVLATVGNAVATVP